MTIKMNGQPYVLWRAVDSEGFELDIFLQKRRDKKAVIRFLSDSWSLIQSHEWL